MAQAKRCNHYLQLESICTCVFYVVNVQNYWHVCWNKATCANQKGVISMVHLVSNYAVRSSYKIRGIKCAWIRLPVQTKIYTSGVYPCTHTYAVWSSYKTRGAWIKLAMQTPRGITVLLSVLHTWTSISVYLRTYVTIATLSLCGYHYKIKSWGKNLHSISQVWESEFSETDWTVGYT